MPFNMHSTAVIFWGLLLLIEIATYMLKINSLVIFKGFEFCRFTIDILYYVPIISNY